jgi:hypothetical protein
VLRALSDDFELAGVANTSLASARPAAAAFGLPRAFKSTAELVASPDVDVVVVTVKVPCHRELVSEANGLPELWSILEAAGGRRCEDKFERAVRSPGRAVSPKRSCLGANATTEIRSEDHPETGE